jgi:hypothetical protein
MKKLIIMLMVLVLLAGPVSAMTNGGAAPPERDRVLVDGGEPLPRETSIGNDPEQGIIIWSRPIEIVSDGD